MEELVHNFFSKSLLFFFLFIFLIDAKADAGKCGDSKCLTQASVIAVPVQYPALYRDNGHTLCMESGTDDTTPLCIYEYLDNPTPAPVCTCMCKKENQILLLLPESEKKVCVDSAENAEFSQFDPTSIKIDPTVDETVDETTLGTCWVEPNYEKIKTFLAKEDQEKYEQITRVYMKRGTEEFISIVDAFSKKLRFLMEIVFPLSKVNEGHFKTRAEKVFLNELEPSLGNGLCINKVDASVEYFGGVLRTLQKNIFG